jgi:hypothetical protein
VGYDFVPLETLEPLKMKALYLLPSNVVTYARRTETSSLDCITLD